MEIYKSIFLLAEHVLKYINETEVYVALYLKKINKEMEKIQIIHVVDSDDNKAKNCINSPSENMPVIKNLEIFLNVSLMKP